jgi:ArsR family transcriptional regulator, lead/cadmium/zinc/bismuth-responsive transcriptional repressor
MDKHPSDSRLLYLAEFFKVFGDSTRLRIISILEESELCVNDIAEKLRMNQSAISHQLRILKQNRLVKQRREGKAVFYSLDDTHVVDIFRQGIEHISEQD